MRKTRNSIITSAISLLLCIIMLAGSTFAWFTDIVASNGNIIQSGNLDAQLHWSDKLLDADSSEWIDAEGSKVFDYNRWEPGYTELRYIKVTNAGSLNLKWKLTVEANGPVTSLADVIEVYYVNPVTGELASLDGLESVGTLTEVMAEKTSSQGRLTPKQNAILAIAFHMDEYAGNEYQEISLCDNGFSLKLLATQDVGESDSFGDDYDIDADWGEGTITFTASAPISQVPMIYGTLAGDITIGSGSNISALLPSGVKVAEGATSLDLSVSAVDTDSNITLGDGDSAKSLDVHVYGVATDNTVPMIVNLGAVLEAGLGDTELKLYHTEDGSPVLMTRVDSTSDFAIHNQYTYNTETGEVSIYVKSFSVFSAVKTAADEWDGTSDTSWYNENDTEFTLVTAEQLAGFRDLVDAGNTFEGKTVKLGADIDLKDTLFDPIGFGYYKDNKVVDGVDNNTVFLGTFDGGNHTIYHLYQNGWELDPDKTNYSTYTYSTAGAGLFASIKNATIKNLAISGAEVVFECVDMGVLVGYAQGECHFENIVITNANIANYNRYTGGLVGEVSYGPYGTDPDSGYSHTFKNITVDSNVKVSGLWGSFGCGMGGVIGGKWNDATVYMENVISAAEMDVYNDVVSAYQWYAFRGCGMLIGHTEEPYSDGRTSGIATAKFLTCENVKVYYGDWVNYTYYEFEDQDSGTGRSYPWVRAEAGEYCDAFSNIRYGVPTHNGVKVSDLTDEELKAVATDYTPIVFDQLYGADRGMYGQAAHDGVTVLKKNVKTVYIHNNGNWANLKLDYWYKNGDDTWTNLSEGIDISDKLLENNIYKIEVPSYAYGFKITADGEKEITFTVSDIANNGFYSIEGNHEHSFDDNGDCICGCKKVTVNIADYATANEWANNTQYSEINANDDITVTATGGANTGKLYGGNNWRIYQSDSGRVTISSANGNILSVKITYTIDNTGILTLKNNNIASGTNVDVNDTSVTFGVGNTETVFNGIVRITEIEVVYTTVLACAHKQTITETKAPTCTEAGYTATKCAECSKVISSVAGDPAIGHDKVSTTEKTPSCTESGIKTFTCTRCDYSYSENISALGHTDVNTDNDHNCDVCGVENVTEHNYVDGICDCGEKEPVKPTHECESKCAECSKCTNAECEEDACTDKCQGHNSTPTWTLVTDASKLQAGDKIVIVAKEYNYALSTTQNNNNRGQASVTKNGNTVTFGDNVQILTIVEGTTSGTFAFYTGSGYLYAASSSSNYLKTQTPNNANGSWKIAIAADGIATIVAQGTNTRNTLQYNQSNSLFACYSSASQKAIVIYKLEGGSNSEGGDNGGETEHTHNYVGEVTIAATCTTNGVMTYTCTCGEGTYTEVIKATGHNYVDGTCSLCGEKDPNAGGSTATITKTLTFDNTSKRTEYSTTKQVWTENGITLTNNKSSSTNNVADYSKPVRLYANSKIVVEASGKITKIVFDCNSSTYATALKNSIGSISGATVTVSSDKVTVEFSEAVDSFTIAKLTAQVRLDSITVTYISNN